MVCGKFKESICRKIRLEDVVEERLMKLLRVGCGQEGLVADDDEELLSLGELAERLQMETVRSEIEDKLLSQLNLDSCLKMIEQIQASGLARLQKACYHMLRDNFEGLSKERGILMLSEETMWNLLEDDKLKVGREEVTFETLLRWMRGGEGMRGQGLLRKIRYGVMSDEYLLGHLSSAALYGDEEMQQLIKEALTKKGVVAGMRGNLSVWDGVERLCDKWMLGRGMEGRIIGADVLSGPQYIAVDGQGRIIVSDGALEEILIFNYDGSIERRFGSKDAADADGQFEDPMGVAVDRQGHIVVADYGKRQIQVLKADGSVVHCFESASLYPLGAHGLAIDMEGHIVVADCYDHQIQVVDMEGSVVRHFGSQGAAVGQLTDPRGVAVDATGRIVVADCGNHRVQVFNCDGTVALCFGSEGDGPGQFREPSDVAVDREGRFVVADTLNHRVQVLNPDGSVARVIGSSGQGVGQLRYPYGVVVNETGRIIVVEGLLEDDEGSDIANCRVQIF